jgi:putative membrane protein
MTDRTKHLVLLVAVAAVFVWSFIGCHDVFTWIMEVFPAVIGVGVLVWIYPKFRFTTFVYVLIAMHAVILMIGGHYTYAREPVFEWLKGRLHLDRNYYDRLGHFAQGFVPAMIAREVLLRITPLKPGKMLFYLVLSVCMAISAWYELLEFAVARATGSAAEDFLGTQGDPWDTQWDMTLCFIGALCALLLFRRIQDHFLKKLRPEERVVSAART